MKNFKLNKVTAAVIAATSIAAAPQLAHAAASAATTAGLVENFQAPVVNGVFTPSTSANVRFNITRDGVAANADGMELVAFVYDASNNYLGFVRGGATDYTASKAAATFSATASLPAGSTQAIFVLMYRGDEAAAGNASDDTLNGVAANKAAIILTPGAAPAGRTQFTATGGDMSGATFLNGTYTTAGGATATELNTLGASTGLNVAANRVPLSTGYTGPTLTSAAKDALTPGQIRLSFDAALAAIADGTDVSATVQTQVAAVNKDTPFAQNALGEGGGFNMVTGSTKFYVDHNNAGAFTSAIDNVDILFGSATVLDEAGNAAKTVSNVAVATYAKPAYAGAGQVAIVTNNNPDGGNQITGQAALYSATGVRSLGADEFTVSVRMAEPNGPNFDAADDVGFLPAGSFDAATSNWVPASELLTFRLNTTVNGWYRFDPATGRLQYGGVAAAGAGWADVSVSINKGATALTTIEGQAMTADLASTLVAAGVAPAAVVSTKDADSNGFIDGVSVNYNAPVDALGAAHGFAMKTTGGTTPTLASTFTNSAANANIVVGTLTNPATADWDGNGTGGEAADAAIYTAANFNTSVVAASKYTFGSTSGTGSAQYKYIYDVATGLNRKIATAAQAAPTEDGAPPVILSATLNAVQGSAPAIGNLVVVASEGLSDAGTSAAIDSNYYLFGGSPGSLINLNSGAGDWTGGALSTTTVANDTVTFNNVDASVTTAVLTLGSAPGYTDVPGNLLATDGTKTVTSGTTVYNGPKIVQAVGFRSAAAVGANIDSVLVKFDKGVKLATAGAAQGSVTSFAGNGVMKDGMFKLRATVGANYDIPIPAANVDMTNAASGYVTLKVPTPGIVGTLTNLVVEYDDGVAPNFVVSTDAVQTTIAHVGSFVGANDDDTRTVNLHKNTSTLYTQEIQGFLTTDGTAAVAKGTIIRADLVTFEETVTGASGNITVPCNCSSGKSTVAIDNPAALDGALKAATAAGAKSLIFYVRVTANANSTDGSIGAGAGGVLVELLAGNLGVNDSDQKVIEATIDVASGKISGPDITGQLALLKKITPMLVDTAWQVTSDGKFRFNVGSDKNFTHPAFVLVSLKQPDDKYFRLVTSPVPSFANHLPFVASVNGPAGISQLGTVDLSKFVEVQVDRLATPSNLQGAANDVWQILDMKGEIAKTADKNRSGVKLTMADLMITIDKDGSVISLWRNEGTGADTAFVLEANKAATAFEVNTVPLTSIDNLGAALLGGNAIAFLDDPIGGAVTGTCIGVSGVYTKGLPAPCANAAIDIGKDVHAKLFVPVTNTSTAARSIKAGWALVTMNTAKADLSTMTNVTAVIEMGSGKQVKSWFKGASANSLSATEAGKAYLMYFEKDTTGFAF